MFRHGQLRCDDFAGIQSEMPLSLAQGAQCAPTDFRVLKLGGTPGRKYTGGGNLSWISPYWTPATVPVIHSAVKLLQKGRYNSPQPLELTVAVNGLSDPSNSNHRMASSLRRLSPEEEHIAYLLATWDDISEGNNLQEWDLVWSLFFRPHPLNLLLDAGMEASLVVCPDHLDDLQR